MCNSIEWGRCEICGKETQLERTYFYYPIHCECCGNKENRHFEMIRHCKNVLPLCLKKYIHYVRQWTVRLIMRVFPICFPLIFMESLL